MKKCSARAAPALGNSRHFGANKHMQKQSRLEAMRVSASAAAQSLSRLSERYSTYTVYVSGLLIFAASRVVVVIGVFFGKHLAPSGMQTIDPNEAWYDRLLRWDSGWYLDIIRNGYRYSSDRHVPGSTGFYPLYPLTSKAAAAAFGLSDGHALLLVATAASGVAAVLLIKLIRDELGDELALWSLAFFWFGPLSLFFSVAQTEPLCLALMVLSLVLLRSEKFALASASAGLAFATRSTGIVMIPVILWEIWRRDLRPLPQLIPRMALCGLLAASGLLAFMIFLWIRFGHPMAFATAQLAWMGDRDFFYNFGHAITLYPFTHFNFNDGSWFVFYLALVVVSFRYLRFAVSLYGLGVLMLPYLTVNFLVSTDRYVSPCFPALMCLAILCRKHPWIAVSLIAIFAALLLRESALFSQGYPVT